MKTAEVRILPALTPSESPDEDSFLVVETTTSEQGEETTIDHVRKNATEASEVRNKSSVARSLTATHKKALEWAVAFAALNEIPIVYERRQKESV